jgi:hypothetical protein
MTVAGGQDGYCASVARQRARDAAYNGIDGDMQQQIYARTYADCMAWKSKSMR